jgi:hypothetical protein
VEKVSCAKCGFLSLHDGKYELKEVWQEARDNLEIAHNNGYIAVPICFAMAANLKNEPGPTPGPGRFNETIHKERNCQHFMAWNVGRTPKEHMEMRHEEMMQKFHAEQRNADRQFQERMRDDERRFQRWVKTWDRLWAIVLLVIGVALGYFFKPDAQSPEKPPTVEAQQRSKEVK